MRPSDSRRSPTEVRRLQRSRPWSLPDLRVVWSYRDLVHMLAAREFKPRYRQAVMGVAWVVLQPICTALIFAVVFGELAHLPSDGAPYFLFALCGFIPWSFFSSIVSRALHGLTGNQALVTKVYLPRVLLPISSMLLGYLDLLLSLLLVALSLAYFRHPAGASILMLAPVLVLLSMTTLGCSLLVASLNAAYRDVTYALPVVLQLWMYATPVVYSSTLVPAEYRALLSINPLVVCVEGFRHALLGRSNLDVTMSVVGTASALAVLLVGLLAFKRIERDLADRI